MRAGARAASRALSASGADLHRNRDSGRTGATYARYPRYPQAESAWCDSFFMTASGCGRDDLPATEESLPSHSPSGCPAGRLRAAGGRKRKAGRLTKPPPGGRGRACPSADAKAAGFVKRPRNPGGLRARGNRTRRDTGPSGSGPARRKAGLRSARRHRRRGASAPYLRAGPGFGPGAANRQDPGLRSMDLPGGTEASAKDPAGRDRGFGFGNAEAGRGTQVPNLPSGEPPGLRPCRGARGETAGLRPRTDSGGSGRLSPLSGHRPRNRPARNASPPRLGSTRRDSGGRRQRRPPLLLAGGIPPFAPSRRSRASPVPRSRGNRRAAAPFRGRALDLATWRG